MLPSSPMAPFTPAILAQIPEPEPEPRSDEPVGTNPNPLAPMAPVAVGPQGKCCGDMDGGGGGGGQTPWRSEIDAAGWPLFNFVQISGNSDEESCFISGGANTYNILWLGTAGMDTIFGIFFDRVVSNLPLQVNGDINLTGRILINGVQVLP